MKYYGDIPPHDLELLQQLRDLENWFNEQGDTVPALAAAKVFTCIAHDFFMMSMEEEGERLLKRADKIYPHYFKSAIHSHMENDKDFNQLVTNLTETLALEVMTDYGFSE